MDPLKHLRLFPMSPSVAGRSGRTSSDTTGTGPSLVPSVSAPRLSTTPRFVLESPLAPETKGKPTPHRPPGHGDVVFVAPRDAERIEATYVECGQGLWTSRGIDALPLFTDRLGTGLVVCFTCRSPRLLGMAHCGPRSPEFRQAYRQFCERAKGGKITVRLAWCTAEHRKALEARGLTPRVIERKIDRRRTALQRDAQRRGFAVHDLPVQELMFQWDEEGEGALVFWPSRAPRVTGAVPPILDRSLYDPGLPDIPPTPSRLLTDACRAGARPASPSLPTRRQGGVVVEPGPEVSKVRRSLG